MKTEKSQPSGQRIMPETSFPALSVTLWSGFLCLHQGCFGGALVLGKLPVPGRPTIWITVGQGPTALAVGAGGGCLDITVNYPFFPLSPSLLETARYRLKYCLKGPFNPKQPTNQPTICLHRPMINSTCPLIRRDNIML